MRVVFPCVIIWTKDGIPDEMNQSKDTACVYSTSIRTDGTTYAYDQLSCSFSDRATWLNLPFHLSRFRCLHCSSGTNEVMTLKAFTVICLHSITIVDHSNNMTIDFEVFRRCNSYNMIINPYCGHIAWRVKWKSRERKQNVKVSIMSVISYQVYPMTEKLMKQFT